MRMLSDTKSKPLVDPTDEAQKNTWYFSLLLVDPIRRSKQSTGSFFIVQIL
jgi:hypothetical protein